jgi:hypothetical protein
VLTKSGSFERAITVLTELTLVHKKSPDIIVAAGLRAAPTVAALRSAGSQPRAGFPTRRCDGRAMEKDYKEATQKFEAALQQYPQEANLHFRFGAFLNIQIPRAAWRRSGRRWNLLRTTSSLVV